MLSRYVKRVKSGEMSRCWGHLCSVDDADMGNVLIRSRFCRDCLLNIHFKMSHSFDHFFLF